MLIATVLPMSTRSRSRSPAESRSLSWTFTVNNYTLENISQLEALAPSLKYLVFGKEVGECGTPHLQGFLMNSSRKSFSQVKDMLPNGAHIEPRLLTSTNWHAANYCKKEGDWVEFGSAPNRPGAAGGDAIREKWHVTKQLAKEGKLDDICPSLYIRYYSTLCRIAKDNMKKPDPLPTVCGLWIWGQTGTGKTHAVATQHPDRYIKPLNKWWDGYQGEEIVHLDELAPSHTSWITPYLKKWADKWPFDAEVKGGALQIRPRLVVITSNYPLAEMGFAPEDQPAIARRFREVRKYREQDIIVQ